MLRLVQPEMLDALPPTDPAAMQSRRELRWINQLMGNHRWLRRILRSQLRKTDRVLEIGAGDGQLWQPTLHPASHWAALDLSPRPKGWPQSATWHQADLFKIPAWPDAEIIVANLFLHHFNSESLATLASRIPPSCRLLLACEPARRSLHLWQGKALNFLLRLSEVTRHDMLISIRAGFLGDELAASLQLPGWQHRANCTLLGAYHFMAWR